jgi:hypothetical protein
LLTAEPNHVRDDEEEVYDLGFIVEDRTDNRACLVTRWQRLEEPDAGRAAEEDPAEALPEEEETLLRGGLLHEGRWAAVSRRNAAAEIDEALFAARNGLDGAPYR